MIVAKILAIDDDIRILRLIENALRKDNHTVTIVHSPLDLDFTRIKDFELIILDIMMPHIDGYTLCEKIRELVDCPIIFLTAKTMEQDVYMV